MTPVDSKSRKRNGDGRGRGEETQPGFYAQSKDLRRKPDVHNTPALLEKVNLTDRQHTHKKRKGSELGR